MDSSKQAWDDVGERVGGLGKALSKRFKKESNDGATVTDEQLKDEAKAAGRTFLGAVSATVDEVGNRLSEVLDSDGAQGGDAAPVGSAPASPATVDPATLPPPGTAASPSGPVDPATLPPPGTAPGAGSAVDPATLPPPGAAPGPAAAVDPATLPPPGGEEDPST